MLMYYLNYIVKFADSSTDRTFCLSHCHLDIWLTELTLMKIYYSILYVTIVYNSKLKNYYSLL